MVITMGLWADDKEDKLRRINQASINSADCIVFVDNEKLSFEKLCGKGYWDQKIPQEGSVEELQTIMFHQDRHGFDVKEEKYAKFFNMQVYNDEDTHGKLLRIIDGTEHKFDYFTTKIDEKSFAIIIKEYPRNISRDSMEFLKMDTIQETYLFSMIVNLSTDVCLNANTTELSGDDQSYQNFVYSEWRNTIINMFHEEDRKTFMKITSPDYIISQLKKEQRFTYELEMMNLQGEFIWVRLIFHRIVGFSRDNPIFVYTVVDIHQEMMRLLMQQNIIKASLEQNEKLKFANQEKNTFISTTSHELRTPLNAIIGMSEVLLRENLSHNVKKNIHIINSASKGLLTIINDLLDLSKIEAGKIEIVKEDYEILSIVNDVCAMINSRNEEKKLDLHFDISTKLPCVLYGDSVRIKQVMINLANNAVKYTDKGSVTISLNFTPLDDGYVNLLYSVEDTGQGIREEDLPKLFKKYNQLNVKQNHHKEGTGLGLSIAKSMIELMGGTIGVQSKFGEGSKFYFELPQRVVNAEAAGSIEDYTYEGRTKNEDYLFCAPRAKILIVDDNEINLIVAENLLSILKMQIDIANDYNELLKLVKQQQYDLIFMDNYMPEVDGVELTKMIRAMDGNSNKDVPIVAMTADAMSGVKEKMMAAGMNDCVNKPIELDKICNVIRKFIPQEYIEQYDDGNVTGEAL